MLIFCGVIVKPLSINPGRAGANREGPASAKSHKLPGDNINTGENTVIVKERY
jgi:hypothetical protein